MRRCVRLNFYRQDDSTVDQLVADLDDGFVCCCFIERSARSSLYFAWTQAHREGGVARASAPGPGVLKKKFKLVWKEMKASRQKWGG